MYHRLFTGRHCSSPDYIASTLLVTSGFSLCHLFNFNFASELTSSTREFHAKACANETNCFSDKKHLLRSSLLKAWFCLSSWKMEQEGQNNGWGLIGHYRSSQLRTFLPLRFLSGNILGRQNSRKRKCMTHATTATLQISHAQ